MKSKEEQAYEVPFEEQRQKALEHYREISSAQAHWSGFVEAAIIAYNPVASQHQGAGLREALEDLLEAIPKQTVDADWWEDDLTRAVDKANKLLNDE